MTTQPNRAWILAASLTLALSLAGCHKNPPVAYQPPAPPPAIAPDAKSSAASPASTAGAKSPGASATKPRPPATESSATGLEPVIPAHAKPVSTEIGLASWYGPPYTNRKAADGSVFDQNAMTAAHRTLPMGSLARVTNLATNQTVVVRITDRGPFVEGRIIDLSLAAAKVTGLYRTGVANVRVEAYYPTDRPVDPEGRWCVQIGAFSDPDDAVQLKNDLLRRYSAAKVIEFAGPTGHWVRINAKNPDKATATQIADHIFIPDPGVQPFLVRLN